MVDDQYVGKEDRDNRNAEKRRSERHVSKTVQAIESFNNPFVIPDEDKVYCISSGALASVVIEVDILRADSVGRDSKENFITNRLEAKVNFFEPIKRLNLKTMSAMHMSVKVTTSKNDNHVQTTGEYPTALDFPTTSLQRRTRPKDYTISSKIWMTQTSQKIQKAV